MRKKCLFVKFAALFVLLSMLTFLGTSVELVYAQVKDDNVVFTEKDHNKEVRVKVGDVIQIELEGLGSAGYWWHIDNLDSAHLELISQTSKLISGQIGAPALGIWTFKVIKSGNTKIKMDHFRKWEGRDKSAKNFLIKLNNE